MHRCHSCDDPVEAPEAGAILCPSCLGSLGIGRETAARLRLSASASGWADGGPSDPEAEATPEPEPAEALR